MSQAPFYSETYDKDLRSYGSKEFNRHATKKERVKQLGATKDRCCSTQRVEQQHKMRSNHSKEKSENTTNQHLTKQQDRQQNTSACSESTSGVGNSCQLSKSTNSRSTSKIFPTTRPIRIPCAEEAMDKEKEENEGKGEKEEKEDINTVIEEECK